MENTLSIIKPDAIKRNLEGKILAMIQENGFTITALKKMQFTKESVSKFYQIHSEKSFFPTLCEIMSSGPVVCSILNKSNAVNDYRSLMGATNPLDSAFGTIRKLYGKSIDENTVHGSDSIENANKEIHLIFHETEIFYPI